MGGPELGSGGSYEILDTEPLPGRTQPDSHRPGGGSGDNLRGREQVPMWSVGPWPQQPQFWAHPPIQASFDGSPDVVVLFLSQVISHFDLYGRFYPLQWAMVVAITTALKGEAADWVANLHSEHARELTNVGMFLEGLRAQFDDETRAQTAEGEIVAIKQRGWSAKEYVRKFRKLASRPRTWPERLLIHQFHMGLDRDLKQACVYQGLPPHLTVWFTAAIDMDIGLQEFRDRGKSRRISSWQIVDRTPPTRGTLPTLPKPKGGDSARWPGLRCFHCDQEGHHVTECPVPPPRLQTPMTGDKTRDRNKADVQTNTILFI